MKYVWIVESYMNGRCLFMKLFSNKKSASKYFKKCEEYHPKFVESSLRKVKVLK